MSELTGYVTLGWSGKPQLQLKGGYVYPSPKVDRIFHPEHFIEGQSWPVDPVTKEKLEIRPRS